MAFGSVGKLVGNDANFKEVAVLLELLSVCIWWSPRTSNEHFCQCVVSSNCDSLLVVVAAFLQPGIHSFLIPKTQPYKLVVVNCGGFQHNTKPTTYIFSQFVQCKLVRNKNYLLLSPAN